MTTLYYILAQISLPAVIRAIEINTAVILFISIYISKDMNNSTVVNSYIPQNY